MTDKIFITGATGFTGSKLVDFLLKKNTDITLYVRDVEKVKKLYPQAKNLNIVQGDYTTVDVFEREIAGHTRLFILVSSLNDMPNIKGTFAKIAYAAGVQQIVDISSGSVNHPYRYHCINAAHRASEEAILAAKGDSQFYVTLRPHRLLSNHIRYNTYSIKKNQTIDTVNELGYKEDFTSPTDIAELASVVLTEPVEKHANGVYSMVSETLSTEERATIFREALGKPIKANQVPMKDVYDQFISKGYPHDLALAGIQKTKAGGPTPYYSVMLNRPPQTLCEWLQEDNNLSHFQ